VRLKAYLVYPPRFIFSVATAGLRDAKAGNDAPETEGAAQPQEA